MGPQQCQVCSEAVSKYKCPSCLVPYCSLACFKKHKATPCAKPVPSEEKLETSSTNPVPSEEKIDAELLNPEDQPFCVDDESEVLQESQLESIASSIEIRDALKNKDLQKLIYKIDGSSEPERELERAMEMEAFRIFTEKVLSAVSP